MAKLQAASDIVKKAYMKRDSLALKLLQPVHVHTSDKCEYWLESIPNLDGKAILHFIGKRREMIDGAGAIQKQAKEGL